MVQSISRLIPLPLPLHQRSSGPTPPSCPTPLSECSHSIAIAARSPQRRGLPPLMTLSPPHQCLGPEHPPGAVA